MSDLASTLSTLGLDLSNALSVEALVKLRAEYETTVASATNESPALSEFIKTVRDELNNDEELSESVSALLSEVSELIGDALDNDPRIAVVLMEGFDKLRDVVKSERDFVITKTARQRKPDVVASNDEYDKARDKAIALNNAIQAIYSLIKDQVVDSDTFPLKALKDGSKTPKLSNIPRSRENALPAGRAAIISKMRFRWNGEDLPETVGPTEVAHDFVSNRKTGFVISWKGVQDAITEAHKNDPDFKFWSHKGTWTVEFPTGSLVGWIERD